MEYVDYQVPEVEENPSPLRPAFAPQRFRTVLNEFVFDLRRYRLHLAFIVPTGHQENVGERQRPRNIQRHQILRRLRIGRRNRNRQKFASVIGCGHRMRNPNKSGKVTNQKILKIIPATTRTTTPIIMTPAVMESTIGRLFPRGFFV